MNDQSLDDGHPQGNRFDRQVFKDENYHASCTDDLAASAHTDHNDYIKGS